MIFSEILTNANKRPKILIAGCGTGNQIIEASRYKNADIIAIDLSKKSLAYATRKTREYGMKNVKFIRMNLLELEKLNQNFDIIECGGVLHHLKEPCEGLQVLNQHLKRGGYIKLGLYSELARQDIKTARETIKSHGIDTSPESIRDFRRRVISGEFQELINLSLRHDFYSLSTCRDLCFHIQEHRYTAIMLKEMLNKQNLEFCGFMLSEEVKNKYQKNFPHDVDQTSLINWAKFEELNPLTFRSMYQFWSYKP